ncbi:MAG: signal peptidase I [Erysipelotrichaceae bacterium]
MEKLKLKIEEMIAVVLAILMMYLDDLWDIIKTVVITCVVCFLITHFVVMPVRVNGTSMYPTLYNNSIGFSSVISTKIEQIERFDIVIVHLDDKNENLVKRVIGLPNETIEYIDDVLYVNGTAIEETFLDQQYCDSQKILRGLTNFTGDFSYQLGENEYFCLGDNRPVSSDSRFYGPFSSEQIIAKGVFAILPISQFGLAQ